MSLRTRLTGATIPAHPLALTPNGTLDERSQRALTRYYCAAGATGLAVGVHTTQFELHHDRGLLRDVMGLAADTAAAAGGDRLLIAGVTGDTEHAVAEATLAHELGYEAVLLTSWGVPDPSPERLLERAARVGEVLPTIGFYLQAAIGGPTLDGSFWSRLFDQPTVAAVKVAPFDRYRTSTVLRALAAHDRWDDVVALTGNDDAIVADLVTPTRVATAGGVREVRVTGGLLGQWAVGTRAAVELTARAGAAAASGQVDADLLALGADLTRVNQALFDVDHDFAGCVPGVNELLRQLGLVDTALTLGSDRLSPGQSEDIAAVLAEFPALLDAAFVHEHVDAWRS
ncbi:dihydrodipicolinate synthase family protein [Propioniciclava coleopterorum]|uniref:Dihydrodipicolinate synthase family protein n=1 Tax=Propioniciclava coleopterorum TaxID=2714937 RepID=A0A6G7Y321_9ACTN|nr:dihydrodipicolinate synthase family protein [Propioniciclava coleopterorum]QIK71021.1 dihydrodipicolinate synthase family protein [Propioniciclava coleopterorum]